MEPTFLGCLYVQADTALSLAENEVKKAWSLLNKDLAWRRLTFQRAHSRQEGLRVSVSSLPSSDPRWDPGVLPPAVTSAQCTKWMWFEFRSYIKLRIRFTRRLNNQNNSRQEPVGDDVSESNILRLSLSLRQLCCGPIMPVFQLYVHWISTFVRYYR